MKNIWKNYFEMLIKSKLPWVLLIICLAISLGRAQLTLMLADNLGKAIVEYANIHDAIVPLLVLFIIGISIIILKVIGSHMEGIVTAQIERNIQKYAVNKAFYLKTSELEKGDPREIVTRLTDDTTKSAKFLIDLAVNEIPRLYYIVAALVQVMALKLPYLTVTLLLVIPIIFVGSFISGKITFKNRNKIQQKIANLTARLAEKIDNVEIIKSYSNEEKEIASGNVLIKELDKVKKQGAIVDQVNAFVKNLMWFLPLLCIIIPPATYLFKGELTQGNFYAYILLATTFRSYTAEHLTLWIYLKDAQGATLRLANILSLDNEKSVVESKPSSGDIEFKDVSFSYDTTKVLDHVSFRIKKGQKTAIVGFSGSGKSTILNLIEKFYAPDEGAILMNNQDIQNYDYLNYRRLFTYLPQNAPGFEGSIRDMLNYCSETPHRDEELLKVLEKVDLAKDVESLGGLDFNVGTSAIKLSGGQRQKIGVARLLLSDSEFVLLDESTSALDAVATTSIQKEIDKACANRTQITIAHDLSTVKNADQILVFTKGKLIASGTHDELIQSCLAYQDLLAEVA